MILLYLSPLLSSSTRYMLNLHFHGHFKCIHPQEVRYRKILMFTDIMDSMADDKMGKFWIFQDPIVPGLAIIHNPISYSVVNYQHSILNMRSAHYVFYMDIIRIHHQ